MTDPAPICRTVRPVLGPPVGGAVTERDTDSRQALVGSLRRLARHMRSWDATLMAEYRAGLRTAVALAFLGTSRTDRVDEWVADLLDEVGE